MHTVAVLLTLLAAPADWTPETDEFLWIERFHTVDEWRPRPEWLSNSAARAVAVRDGQAACFRVDEPGRGMKWWRPIAGVSLAERSYLLIRYRAENLYTARTDYLLFADDRAAGRELYAVRLNEAKADALACRRGGPLDDDRCRPNRRPGRPHAGDRPGAGEAVD